MTPDEAIMFLVTAFKWYLIGLVVFGIIGLVTAVIMFRRINKRRVTINNRIDAAITRIPTCARVGAHHFERSSDNATGMPRCTYCRKLKKDLE